MKTAADLLREKDAELDQLIEVQVDAWEQEDRLRRFGKELEGRIREVEKEISELTIKWQEEIRREKEGRNEQDIK